MVVYFVSGVHHIPLLQKYLFLHTKLFNLSETLHLPQLHLYKSSMGIKSCMLHVQQQQHVLHAHSNVCESFGSSKSLFALQQHSRFKKYIPISITMPISLRVVMTVTQRVDFLIKNNNIIIYRIMFPQCFIINLILFILGTS